jgi:hypothetical protein
MRRTTPVLALSTILASILFAPTQHAADAACANAEPGCNEPAHAIGPLAQAERRPGIEEWRSRERELPTDLWDRVRSMAIPEDRMAELSGKITDIVRRYAEAGGHVHEAERRIFEADEAIFRARDEKTSAEDERRAAEQERGRQFSRFIFVLEDALREFRPPPPPRWRPHRVFWHHFRGNCEVDPCGPCGCPVEQRPVFFPLLGPAHSDP